MKSRWLVLRAFIRKEVVQVLRDPRMRTVLTIAPLLQLTIFGVAISSETKNIRLAVWGRPGETRLRDIYVRALGTTWFIPADVAGDDPFEWVRSGAADAVLVAPTSGFDRAEARGAGRAQVLINAKNSMRAQAIEFYLNAVLQSVLKAEEKPEGRGVHFEIRALYNPTFETSRYMVPGVLSMLVCLVTIMLTSMAVAREKEVGTIETLTAAPVDTLDLLLGKTVPFILMGSVQAVLILTFAVIVFDLPVRGPIVLLASASLGMISATVAIGLLISTIAKNQQQAMLGGFLYLFPSYLLSGLMFPVENMPLAFQVVSYLNPLTHYMGLLRNILLLGGDLNYFFKHLFVLCAIGTVLAAIAFHRFRRMLAG